MLLFVILTLFVFLGFLFLIFALNGSNEPVIEEETKQKTGYYEHNNKYYDSFDTYLRERNAERDREREREKIRRDAESRYQYSYEKWRKNMKVLVMNQTMKKWKRERYKDKSDNNSKVDKIFNLIVKDFSNNPYHDKIQSIGSSHSISFNYKFENGFRFTLNDKDIRVYNRDGENISSYRLGDLYHLKFLKLILEIKQKAQHRFSERNYRTYTEYDFNSKFNDYKKEYKKEQPKEPKVKSTGNPRLDKINEKIVLREEQLRKMKANDPERQALVNELETYKNVAKKMKAKIK